LMGVWSSIETSPYFYVAVRKPCAFRLSQIGRASPLGFRPLPLADGVLYYNGLFYSNRKRASWRILRQMTSALA
jgi:hypothetical protein